MTGGRHKLRHERPLGQLAGRRCIADIKMLLFIIHDDKAA